RFDDDINEENNLSNSDFDGNAQKSRGYSLSSGIIAIRNYGIVTIRNDGITTTFKREAKVPYSRKTLELTTIILEQNAN
ncbi:8284_t:CDS:2, partial [Gigaspora rosea]